MPPALNRLALGHMAHKTVRYGEKWLTVIKPTFITKNWLYSGLAPFEPWRTPFIVVTLVQNKNRGFIAIEPMPPFHIRHGYMHIHMATGPNILNHPEPPPRSRSYRKVTW
jgi:hypothetical protein